VKLKAIVIGVLLGFAFFGAAAAQTCPSGTYIPHTFSNGTTADASQVNDNFTGLLNCSNTLLAPLANPHLTGLVGIGTTSPASDIHIVNSQNGQTGIRIDNANSGTAATSLLDLRNGGLTTSERLLVGATGSGYTGVGGWQDAGLISAQSGLSGGLVLNASAGGIFLEAGGNGSSFRRMSIGTTGLIGVGVTPGGWSTDGALSVQSSTAGNIISSYQASTGGTAFLARVDNTAANLAAFYYAGSLVGSITTSGTTTAFNTTSDYRLKTNVEPMTDGLTRLMKLQPRKFNWKAALNDPKSDGFIAHELQAVVPGAVTGKKDEINKDGSIKPQQVDYSKLVPLLVAALQDEQAEIESLKTQVAALKAGH
jgi:hypothetical protein